MLYRLQLRVRLAHQHIPPRHPRKPLLPLVQLRVVPLDVFQVVGYQLLRRQLGTAELGCAKLIVPVHLLTHRTVRLAPRIPAANSVSRILRRSILQRTDVVLRPLLSRRGTEPHKRKHLVQPLDVLHQVVLHLQLAGHRKPALSQFPEHIAETLHHLSPSRLAHDVSRLEIVAAQHVHRNVLVHPLPVPRLTAQCHVVHRYLAQRPVAHLPLVFRSHRVLVGKVPVPVRIHRRRVHRLAHIAPHCRLAQLQRPSLVTEIVRPEHLARLFVIQLPVPRHKLHIQLPHPLLERLPVRPPQRHNQVLRLHAHLPRVVVAYRLAYNAAVTLVAIRLKHPFKTPRVAYLRAGELLPLLVVPLHRTLVPFPHLHLAPQPRPLRPLRLQSPLQRLHQARPVRVLLH